MSTKVIMPQMGESIFEGTITKWLKKVGERVSRDEPLFEISTDKVDSEIPSPAAGIVTQILAPEGKTVQINAVVAIIGEESAETFRAAEQVEAVTAVSQAPPVAPAVDGETGGEEKAVAQSPLEMMPELPAAATPPVPATAPAAEDRAAPQQDVPPTAESKTRPSPEMPRVQPRDIRTSPLVRRLAREHNIELCELRGTGLEGRITKQDILDYIEQRAEPAGVPGTVAAEPGVSMKPAETAPEAAVAADAPSVEASIETSQASAPPAAAPLETPRFLGETEIVPMTPMRKAIAEHMVLSQRTSAHVNTVFEVDMTAIVQLREKHKDEFEKREGVKLTYTPFFVKALVDTVREFPVFNCSVSGDNIVHRKPINVGVAVALATGLIVPVVKDAHLRSFTGIALAINDLSLRARTKRLKPDDVQNGTISITNPGIYGSLFGTPIISQPQVAILGVGGIEKRPVVINDAIAVRSMVYLSLTFDHRVIDGALADQFMASLKNHLQSWSQWLD